MPTETPPPIGHNQGPPLIVGDQLSAHLEMTYAEITARATDLLENEQRFINVGDDNADSEATEFMVKVRSAWKTGDTNRLSERDPYETASGLVHAFFKTKILDPLQEMGVRINEAQKQYKLGVMRAAQEDAAEVLRQRVATEKAAAELAATKQREADELAKAAARAKKPERVAELKAAAETAQVEAIKTVQAANIAAESRAEASTVMATPAADLTRNRGKRGGVSSLREVVSVRDIDREKLGHWDNIHPEPDIVKLLPYIDDKALLAAANGWIAANKAAAEKATAAGAAQPIRGMVIFMDYTNVGRK